MLNMPPEVFAQEPMTKSRGMDATTHSLPFGVL
jgi:hypothetical protein